MAIRNRNPENVVFVLPDDPSAFLPRWFVLQAIDDMTGAPVLEWRLPGSAYDDLAAVLGKPSEDSPWTQAACWLDAPELEALTPVLGHPFPAGGRQVLITDWDEGRRNARVFVHDGYELALLLDATKPLAVFSDDSDMSFDEVDKRLSGLQGLLSETVELPGANPGDKPKRHVLVARAAEAWRIGAFKYLLHQAAGRSLSEVERSRELWLLGYSDEDAAWWIERRRGKVKRPIDTIIADKALLYGPSAVLAILFAYALFGTDAGGDLLRASRNDFWSGLKFAVAIDLVAVMLLAGLPILTDAGAAALQSRQTRPAAAPRKASVRHARAWLAAFLFPTTYAAITSVFLALALVVLLAIEHSWTLAFGAAILGLILNGQTIARLIAFVGRRSTWGGLVIAIAIVVLMGALPASVAAFAGSALVAALACSAWMLFAIVVARLRRERGTSLTLLALTGIAMFCVLTVAAGSIGFDGKDRLRVASFDKQPLPAPELPSMQDALAAWQRGAADPPHHLVLVAAAGGGMRASYWTSLVLARTTDQAPAFRRELFLASGVSGGSLGLAVYRALLDAPNAACGRPGPDPLQACVKAFHDHDYLGAPLAATLSGYLLNVLFPFGLFPSRSRALEHSWEVAWRDVVGQSNDASEIFAEPFLALARRPGPALVLNATEIEGGNRMVASTIATEPWLSTDGASKLVGKPCPANIAAEHSIPLSAAAGVSARFPYLTEWGWFERAPRTGCKPSVGLADGGFFDNYGAVTIGDALAALRDKPGPDGLPKLIIIQITNDSDCGMTVLNGPDQTVEACTPAKILEIPDNYFWTRAWWTFWRKTTRELHEAVAKRNGEKMRGWFGFGPNAAPGPLTVLMNARSSSGIAAAKGLKEEAARLGASYYHFSMAGARDVPLSWALSAGARLELDDLLKNGPNAAELCRLVTELNSPCSKPVPDAATSPAACLACARRPAA